MTESDSVRDMWNAFSAAKPDLAEAAGGYTAWHFCDNETDANELAELVLAGVKRATASCVWTYEAEGEELPKPGDCSVIIDWAGEAQCVIMTTRIDIVPFGSVTEEFAAVEGEGDGSLAFWREAHIRAFGRELAAYGRELADDTPVVCERFEVVHRKS